MSIVTEDYIGHITICTMCGGYNTLQNPCNCAKGYQGWSDKISAQQVAATKPSDYSLEDLYNELGTLKWGREPLEWEDGIKAVRAFILEKLNS